MKNLLKGVALVAGLFISTQVVNAQQKIGHINSGEILQSTADFKTAADQLKALTETKEKEFQGMVTVYTEKQTAYNDKLRNRSEANKTTVDTELQTLGEEMRQIEGRIQEIQKVSQEELGKKEQELFAPIQQKVMTAINAVAQEKGYAYVLDLAAGSVIYFQGGEDISADVKAKLGVK
ncbi:OmpH family outer membrane protein [Sphingobacterium alkalisoli]|uniref:OmpH family outer membrane protein n=1 Tax=Sphingobacterium alkalisoli TaxID=1874115 RepID=A0A4U0GWG5_9SPHI|nr:OmpH family outer membrane protein [Sphingobacterium alkalisoli]TJY63470.1 OmpH family outer membrane protein [Sphingobacterium alkalisoli]